MRMTTVINTSNSEVTTPTSYISRWIAQSHNAYHNKTKEFYSSSSISSSDSRTPTVSTKNSPAIISPISIAELKNPTTTWWAQAQSRLDASSTTTNNDSLFISSIDTNNNELQEKLHRIRDLLEAKKKRFCRQFSSSSSFSSIPQDRMHSTPVVVEHSTPPPPAPSLPYSVLALENAYPPHGESRSSINCIYHASPILPCLMEESPSDSGFSDGTKTTNNEDVIDSITKNPAVIDLSKPLSKEEMLAVLQILRELWKKRFGTDIPSMQIKPTTLVLNSTEYVHMGKTEETLCVSKNKKIQHHSTSTLNKLSAELSDIKDKLKRFSNGGRTDEEARQTLLETKPNGNIIESENIQINGNHLVFIPLGAPLTPHDLERMQTKKDALIRRQIQRREEQLVRKNERLIAANEHQKEYRLYEEYTNQRRQQNNLRRKNILQAHIEQKRLEADPPSSHDYYFAAARNRNRLKRKASMTSFVSFDDDISCCGSTFDLVSIASGKKSIQTPRRNTNRFDYVSPSLTASTTASRSKMNRAASICNINQRYDSFTSLNSKATIPIIRTAKPPNLFGGSLMNISTMSNRSSQKQSFNLLDDSFDLTMESPLSGSFSSMALSTSGKSRLVRSQAHLSTKSNKQSILNSLKQIVLAGPANERQRDIVTREIQLCEARHFIILFRDHRLQFRAIYMYIPETDMIEKLYGIGPNIITELMVEKWFKYNSGSKRFNNIPVRHFSIQCDAIIIYNDFWQKKLLIHMNKSN